MISGELTVSPLGECPDTLCTPSPMQAHYFRINRHAYTAGELSVVTVGPRRWLLPAFIARLFVLKLLRKTVPIGDPIADIRLLATLDDREALKIRERYPFLKEVEGTLAGIGFTDIRYCRGDDPRYRYATYGLYAVDGSGSTGVTCVVMGNAQFQVNWIEFYSLLLDGRTLRSNNHSNAGALRPVPSAIIGRVPGRIRTSCMNSTASSWRECGRSACILLRE